MPKSWLFGSIFSDWLSKNCAFNKIVQKTCMVLCQTDFKEGYKPADPTVAAPQYQFQNESHLLPSKENRYVNKYY